jgi:hypothetical protein
LNSIGDISTEDGNNMLEIEDITRKIEFKCQSFNGCFYLVSIYFIKKEKD